MTDAVGPGLPPPKRRVLFVGDRSGVFEAALQFPELDVEWTWAVAGSALAARLVELGRSFEAFEPDEAPRMIDALERTPFDLLVSNGCPIVLPVGRLARSGRLFVNVHPSPLPEMRGRHPVNGALLFGRGYIGATMHHMAERVDGGRVISQARLEVTDDLDLGLLYHLAFGLEAEVFRSGMQTLIVAGFDYPGMGQPEGGSCYSRRDEDMQVDFGRMDDADILKRIRAFGVRTQGAVGGVGDIRLRVFEARAVHNSRLLEEFRDVPPGTLALAYDGKLLVRTRQGLLVLTSFVEIESGVASER